MHIYHDTMHMYHYNAHISHTVWETGRTLAMRPYWQIRLQCICITTMHMYHTLSEKRVVLLQCPRIDRPNYTQREYYQNLCYSVHIWKPGRTFAMVTLQCIMHNMNVPSIYSVRRLSINVEAWLSFWGGGGMGTRSFEKEKIIQNGANYSVNWRTWLILVCSVL